jgi:MFS family permease
MGYANAFFFSGFGFGPLIGGVVTEHLGMTTAFLILISLSLFASLVALLFLPEVKQKKVEEQEEGPRLSYREMSASGMIRGLFSFRMAQALGRAGIGSFLPIYAAAIGLSTSTIGMLITINILSVTVLSPVGGYAADRFDRRMLTIISSIVFTVILIGIPLSGNFWLLLLLLLVQGLSAAVSMPAATAITVDEGRKFGMGSTMSVLFFAQAVGAGIGPIISGVIHDAINVDWVFYFGAIMSGIGTFLFAWFSRGSRPAVEPPTGSEYQL